MTSTCRLSISNFSAIREAEIDLKKLTLITGPQASGKSVISKLFSFFQGVYWDFFNAAVSGATFDSAKNEMRQRFHEWFPPSAWGREKFEIEFVNGPVRIRVVRVIHLDIVKDQIRINIPDELKVGFREFSATAKKYRPSEGAVSANADLPWRLHEPWTEWLRSTIGESYIDRSMFIPAGRSFFTSLGRAVTVFEHAGLLDPTIVNFGRLIARVRERGFRAGFSSRHSSDGAHFTAPLYSVLGGKIVSERGGHEFVIATDGRKVPFSVLSSGQQELIPLIAALESLHPVKVGRQVVYIEEPEAHLFPAAQSELLKVLVSMCNSPSLGVNILLTTHSPYILAKANNLIKAADLAIRLPADDRPRLDQVVPAGARLAIGDVSAYAIDDGKLQSIVAGDGLIDADYLDGISGQIAAEFSALLDLEPIA